MRSCPTEAEKYFWNRVRNRRLYGLKFLRQHVIACPIDSILTKFYIADFYCSTLNIVIEIDGPIHKDLNEYDLIRTEHLESKGFRVLRFTNDQVLNQWTLVCESIEMLLERPESPESN
jgi:5-methyltetrahydrofolate--homocysteine methyltransferase